MLPCAALPPQFFWGAAVARMGLGPPPIPVAQLTPDSMADALRCMAAPEVVAAAAAAAEDNNSFDGVAAMVARGCTKLLGVPTG